MAFEEQITETIEAGAPSIKYEGDIQQQQKIAQQLWENLPQEAQMQFGSFQQFFQSGAWKKVLEMVQQRMQQQAPQQMAQQPQEGIGSMMPAQMAGGGDVKLASHESNDAFLEQRYEYYLEQGFSPRKAAEQAKKDLTEGNYQDMAYGGIAGPDGRRAYGIGSWFQKKIMDPIKKNIVPIGLGAASLYGLHKYGGEKGIPGGLGKIFQGGKKILTGGDGKSSGGSGVLSGLLSNPNFLIPAAGLVAGTFAKKDDPGYTGQGAGLNLQDIAKVANITDEKQGAAVGLNFLPEASARKYSPEEMAATYAGAAQGGRIGYIGGGLSSLEGEYENLLGEMPTGEEKIMTPPIGEMPTGEEEAMTPASDQSKYQNLMMLVELFKAQGMSDDDALIAAQDHFGSEGFGRAAGGRIGAQEGGLMSLGGMEMDLRGGGFVPIGEYEKKDDVPARLSKNEFVFTADAVRAAGGGDVDAGADKMYNTMKQLESRVG